jgi:hypothetical protein
MSERRAGMGEGDGDWPDNQKAFAIMGFGVIVFVTGPILISAIILLWWVMGWPSWP